MIDLQEIRDTIEEIKRTGTTVSQAEKLALLYMAADYMEREGRETPAPGAQIRAYAAADEPARETPARIKTGGTSAFLAACEGARVDDVMRIMDEHMEAIRVLYPKEHAAIIRRIEEKQG